MKRPGSGVSSAWIAVCLSLVALALIGPAHASEPVGSAGDGDARGDPPIRAGTLANGIRYVILRHQSPPHEVSLRLRIGAGSLQEPEGQNGVAHVLEHMAFRGSTHVPETEIWRTLARLGLAFGADSNAFTTTSQTNFQFDLPEADPAAVSTGLMLMREIASELTLSPQALNDERHVVMAEARLTDSPRAQAERAQTAFWFGDQPAAGRDAMGDVDFIERVNADQLRAFYNAFYRPERATLLVVGDVDPDAIEAEIRSRFADWQGKGPPGADPAIATPPEAGPRSQLFVQSGAPSSIRLAWIAPKTMDQTSRAAQRDQRLAELALRVLNLRLNSQDGRYLIASASRRQLPPLADVTLLSIDGPPDQWRGSLEAAERVRRQLLRYGTTEAEIEREAGEALQAWQTATTAAATRPSSAIANAMLAKIDNGEALASPADELAMAAETYDKVGPRQVDAAMRALFRGDGPLVFLSSPQPVAGGEAAVARAVADTEAAPVAVPALTPSSAAPVWPYADFGSAGVVVERREAADLGTSLIRFQNGVRLTVRPSAYGGGQIQVQVSLGHGRLDLPRDRMSAIWAADSGVMDAGGLRGLGRADIRRALASSVYSFSFNTADDGFNLTGATRPADLLVQLQVLAAYAVAPGWRAGAFERIQSLYAELLPQFEASPGGALGDFVGGLLHGGDPRWASPSMRDVAAGRPRDLRDLLERTLAVGDVEITVVGDVTVEQAIQAVAKTFGALPVRSPTPSPPPEAYVTRFPEPTETPVVRYHGGHADQALALAAWPIGDAYARGPNLADARVLQQVLNNRLIERLRIADGATYTPRTGLEASRTFPGFGYLYAAASVAPAQTGLVFDRIGAIAADLRATPVSVDELERARKPALAALQRARETNSFWLDALSHAQTDPRRLDLIRSAAPDLLAVSAADVQRAAQAYLLDARTWKLVIVPHADRAQ